MWTTRNFSGLLKVITITKSMIVRIKAQILFVSSGSIRWSIKAYENVFWDLNGGSSTDFYKKIVSINCVYKGLSGEILSRDRFRFRHILLKDSSATFLPFKKTYVHIQMVFHKFSTDNIGFQTGNYFDL